MTTTKRIFDITLALILGALLLLPVAILAVWLLIRQGRPVFFLSERMRSPTEGFLLWKFRTMHVSRGDSGVSGGDKQGRITPAGRILRRLRLDEIPQLWNILKGDISFVGPRPPLRQYVEEFPELYAQVLRSRPGVTGLATLYYHRHEERLLAAAMTGEQTDAIYKRRCVPRKAAIDIIYQNNQSICIDCFIMWKTFANMFR